MANFDVTERTVGLLGTGAHDGHHLDFRTAPGLCLSVASEIPTEESHRRGGLVFEGRRTSA